MLAARVLALTDDADRGGQAAIVRAFTLFLLAHAVALHRCATAADRAGAARWLLTAALAGCALVAWRAPARARAAVTAAWVVLAAKLVATFPTTSTASSRSSSSASASSPCAIPTTATNAPSC
ncbi:MAG: hypothetical protein U0802_08280 [Candidatus Binatia bacterium]